MERWEPNRCDLRFSGLSGMLAQVGFQLFESYT